MIKLNLINPGVNFWLLIRLVYSLTIRLFSSVSDFDYANWFRLEGLAIFLMGSIYMF